MGKREKIFLLILGTSILSRGLTLFTPDLWLDETIVGIMGLRVMAGDFPVFFYGQNFMGSLEAFLAGSLFQFVGPSPLALELLAVILSLIFLILLYRVSKTFFDQETALISIALLSIPPLFLLRWSHEARPHYPLVLMFGNFLLLIAHSLIYRVVTPRTRRLLFILLGLLSGLAWWTNYLSIVYILPVGLFLFLKDKKFLFRKDFLFLLFFFLIGSMPLWTYNVFHRFPITGITNLGAAARIPLYLRDFFTNAFPILLGFLPPLRNDYFDLAGYIIMGPIVIAAILYYIYKFRQSIQSIFFLRISETKGGEIFLLLFFVTIILNFFTHYGSRLSDNDQKYLLPLYTCLPIFLAVLSVDLSKKYYRLSVLLIGLILFSHLAGNLRHDGWTVFNAEHLIRYRQNEKIKEHLTDFLMNNGYRRFYYEGGNYALTLKSRESLISAHPYQEGSLKYADWVDSNNKPAYLSEGEDKVFEENLTALGGRYQKVTAPDGYVLYTHFKPSEEAYRRISRDLWKGTSDLYPEEVKKAFDGAVSTGWDTQGPQKPGTYILLDLGRVETVGKISYIPASYREVPVGYQVALSLEGKDWQIVSDVPQYKGPLFWSGPGPMTKVRHGRVETVFPVRPCRFVKIALLQGSDANPWSINELFLFGPDEEKRNTIAPSLQEQEIDLLLAFLGDQKIKFVYADHWLSAVIRVKSNRQIGTILSNFFTGDNGEQVPPPEQFAPVHLDRNVGLVVATKNNGQLKKVLSESNHFYHQKTSGPFMVFYGFSKTESQGPDHKGSWEVFSNANPHETQKAIDGDPATRWTSGKNQEPGLYYQIDLKTARLVNGCTLFLGKSINDYPRSLKLFYSLDGNSWKELKHTASSDLYWTGETLLILKPTGEKTDYCFSPVYLRYLRLVQEGQDPVYWWSIQELKLSMPKKD